MLAASTGGLFASPAARGDEFRWSAPADGAFGDPARWSPAGTPGPADAAVFDLAAATPYAVAVAAGASNLAALEVRGDDLRLDLEVIQWRVGSIRVGSPSTTTRLTVTTPTYSSFYTPTLTVDRAGLRIVGDLRLSTGTATLGAGARIELVDDGGLSGQRIRIDPGAAVTVARGGLSADQLDLAGAIELRGGEVWVTHLARAPGSTFDWAAGAVNTSNVRVGQGQFFGPNLTLSDHQSLTLFRGVDEGTIRLDPGATLTLDGGHLGARVIDGPAAAFDFRRGTLQLYGDVDTATHPLLGPDHALAGPRTLRAERSATVPAGARFTVADGGVFSPNQVTVRGALAVRPGGTFRGVGQSDLVVDAAPAATALLELAGGTITHDHDVFVARDASARIVHSSGAFSASGQLRVGANPGASGVYELGGGQVRTYHQTVGDAGTGVFRQSGGGNRVTTINSFRDMADVVLGNAPTGDGAYELAGGLLDVRSDTPRGTFYGALRVGVGGQGRFTMTGGTAVAGILTVATGPGSTGAVEIAAGALAVYGAQIGFNGSARYTQTGGRASLGGVTLGTYGGQTRFDLAGGALEMTSLEVAYQGDAVVTQTGGDAVVTGEVVIGVASPRRAAYRLAGGTLTVDSLRVNDGGFDRAPGTFDYDGGRLRAHTVAVQGAFRATNLATLTVAAGGDVRALSAYGTKARILANAVRVEAGGTLSLVGDVLTSSSVTQTGGTIDRQLWNHATYDYHAGDFPGHLVNLGTVTAHADFKVGSLDNRARLSIPAGQEWTVATRLTTGDQLDLAGRLTAASEDFAGSGTFAHAAGVNTVTDALRLGIAAGDDFSYDLRGPAAVLDARRVTLGVAGRAALRVSAGATARAGDVTLAERLGAAAALDLRDPGTRLRTGAMVVGRGGDATLTVAGGATLVSDGDRGLSSESADPTRPPRAVATVSGPGSEWTGPGVLRLGYGATLEVTDGGRVEAGSLRTVLSTSTAAGTIRVDGVHAAPAAARSTLVLTGDEYGYGAYLGEGGAAELRVGNGALVQSTADFRIASRNGNSRGNVVVGGAAGGFDAEFRVTGNLHLAHDDLRWATGGTARATVAAGGRLDVSGTIYAGGHQGGVATLAVTGGRVAAGALVMTLDATLAATVRFARPGEPADAAPVAVANVAQVTGLLDIALAGDQPAPSPGNRFTVLTAAQLTGRFHDYRGLDLGPPPGGDDDRVRHLAPAYEPTRLTLTVVDSLRGDADADGRVTYDDFAVLRKHYGRFAAFYADGDFTLDGRVGAADYLALRPRLSGLTAAQAGEVDEFAVSRGIPEPGALSLLALLFAPVRRRRR
jgi:T5SS/PEP-CTERM-associated repeat protein